MVACVDGWKRVASIRPVISANDSKSYPRYRPGCPRGELAPTIAACPPGREPGDRPHHAPTTAGSSEVPWQRQTDWPPDSRPGGHAAQPPHDEGAVRPPGMS